MNGIIGPHQGQKIVYGGEPLSRARAAMILVHGRGATAESILELANEFDAEGFAFLAPQANGTVWYPNSFLAPIESNEPGISSGLQTIAGVMRTIEDAGIQSNKIMILGFSQGACLTLEFAARNAKPFGGIVGLSGGVIGPDGTPRNYEGSLNKTPVFLGCSDIDFHIPKKRVEKTAEIMKRLGGNVTMRLYPNMGHTVNLDEIEFVNSMMANLVHAIERVHA